MGKQFSIDTETVLKRVDKDEVAELALNLANIDSPSGYEKEVGEFIYSWLEQQGFSPRKVGMLEDRFNVFGRLKGKGNGYSLLFNAHMDTAVAKEDTWVWADAADPIWHSGWREGDKLVSFGIVNDKGPLAATMIAAKAIKESGVQLEGDLLVTAVCSEIARNPVDEFQPPRYMSRHIGAEYMVTHGVFADYALVAEATNRSYTWVECGTASFKLTIAFKDHHMYTPHLPRPTKMEESPNAVVRMAKVIEAFEDWAYEYQQKYQYKFTGGVVVPKAAIMSIRGGDPTLLGAVPGVCSLYIFCFIPPDFNPGTISTELKEMTEKIGVPVDIEMYAYRRGFEGKNVSMLADAVERTHLIVFNEKPRPVSPGITSMWRDVNVFNGFGIPSLTYGPGMSTAMFQEHMTFYIEVDELYQFAKAYALIALDICSKKKE